MKKHQSEPEQRREKLEELKKRHINSYPSQSHRTDSVLHFLEQFEYNNSNQSTHTIAGRIRLKRTHGKILFLHVQDESGQLQIVCSVDALKQEHFSFVEDLIDVGDIVEVSGVPFITKKSERSLLANEVRLLSKALEPLPDKWLGIKDEEARYRKRYLDMLFNEELRALFYKKSTFWNSMRQFLLQEGFLEVETPVLESTPGGADAQPFVTHHNALDIDIYLRISMGELWQKRLMVAGFEKTFEIGRQFRNEGVSPEHLQDYTQMEFYMAYADFRDTMRLVERLYKHVIQTTFGTLKFTIKGESIDFDIDWPELDYTQTLKELSGVDISTASDKELHHILAELGVTVESHTGRGRLIDALWKQHRKSIVGPAFLVNHPVEVSPLAKRSLENPRTVERYQILIAGSELGNGYTELNDPIDQHNRFMEQAAMRESGDAEAQMHDEDFVEALRHGMPPTSGFGVSERLFAFLVDKPIRECVLFPLLRPKQHLATSNTQSAPIEQATTEDQSLRPFDVGITRQEAKEWVYEQVKDANLRRHMLATESVMKAAGLRLGAQSPEAWGVAGLLHDIDYEQVEMEKHSLVGAELLQKRGIHALIVDAVREHNPAHQLPPQTMLSKALLTLETVTGLIMAVTAVRPDKQIASVKASSVKKKFKDKSFAAGVPRGLILQAEPLIGLPIDEVIELCLTAMQQDAKEIGL